MVTVSLDLAAIRRCFGREKPVVREEDWDAAAFLAERTRALHAALEGLDCELVVDGGAEDGNRLTLSGVAAPEAVESPIRRVLKDENAWRLALRPSYFDRYRAWRREAGSPIAH